MKSVFARTALAAFSLACASLASVQADTSYEWTNLTRDNPLFADFPDPVNRPETTGYDAWPRAILPNDVDASDTNVWFNKTSGFGYPSGSSIYHSLYSGTYAVGVDDLDAGITGVSLYLNRSGGGAVTLSYNGGTQAITATMIDGYYTWDITSLSEAVDSLTLNWSQGSHSQIFGIELVLTSAIPEPATWAAIIGGLALAGTAAQRRFRRAG